VILFVLALGPGALLTFLVWHWCVNVPAWDEWGVAELFVRSHTHTLTFAYLISQHCESRKFFPRLIILALGLPTRWNVCYDMGVTLVLAWIVSWNVLCLAGRTLNGSAERRLWLWFLGNCLIFTLAAEENWLLGLQIVVYLPIVCITTALVIFQCHTNFAVKVAAGLALSIIATFSYANGMLAFLLLPPALWLWSGTPRPSLRAATLCGFAWAVGAIGSVGLFFRNYHPSEAAVLVNPLEAPKLLLQFFMAFLGSPLKSGREQEHIPLVVAVGAVLLLMLATVVLRTYLRRRDGDLLRRSMPWLVLAAYSACSAAITSLGRAGTGLNSSLASRYCAFSVFLIVALIYLIPLHGDDSRRMNPGWRRSKQVILALLSIALLALQTETDIAGARDMHDRARARLGGKAALELFPICHNASGLSLLYPSSGKIETIAPLLDQWGYLSPPLIHDPDVRKLVRPTNSPMGSFDYISAAPDGKYFCTGWGWLASRREQADCIFVTADGPSASLRILSLTTEHSERPDAVRWLRQPNAGKLGWMCQVDPASIPTGTQTLSAWAFDAERQEAYYLGTKPIP
jgi:hypothetical protein